MEEILPKFPQLSPPGKKAHAVFGLAVPSKSELSAVMEVFFSHFTVITAHGCVHRTAAADASSHEKPLVLFHPATCHPRRNSKNM